MWWCVGRRKKGNSVRFKREKLVEALMAGAVRRRKEILGEKCSIPAYLITIFNDEFLFDFKFCDCIFAIIL